LRNSPSPTPIAVHAIFRCECLHFVACAITLMVVSVTAASTVKIDLTPFVDRVALSAVIMTAGNSAPCSATVAHPVDVRVAQGEDDLDDDGRDTAFALDGLAACETFTAIVRSSGSIAVPSQLLPFDVGVIIRTPRAPPPDSAAA
jgi:hypothetical protein